MSGAGPPVESLSGRVIRGGLWQMALAMTARALGLLRLVVLARLLTPYDFGLVGLAFVVFWFLEAFSTIGLNLAVIHRGGRTRVLYDTAWSLGLVRGAVTSVVIVASAPIVGWFFGAPDAVPILRGVGLLPLLNALSNIGPVEFRRDLTFGPQYAINVTGFIADVCVAVPLAYWYGSAWALVAGLLAMSVARLVMSYVLHPYRPSFRIDRREARALIGYGRWIFATTVIRWVGAQGVQTVVGRLLGVPVLGIYQMAWRIAFVPTSEFTQTLGGVTMPAYARLQESTARVRDAFLKVLAAVALGSAPVAVGIALYAEDVVRVALGPRWAAVVPVLHILAFAGLLRSMAVTTGPVFQGLGRPGIQTLVVSAEIVPLVVLVVPLTLRMGPAGAAIAATVAAAGGAIAAFVVVTRYPGIPASELLSAIGWPLLACVPPAILRMSLPATFETLVGLGSALAASGLLYVAIILLADRLNLYDLARVVPLNAHRWLLHRRRTSRKTRPALLDQ